MSDTSTSTCDSTTPAAQHIVAPSQSRRVKIEELRGVDRDFLMIYATDWKSSNLNLSGIAFQ